MDAIATHIRWMIRRDVPEVLEIDELNSGGLWHDDLVSFLRKRNAIGQVAEDGDKVVGFMLYLLNKGHIRLVQMSVHPDYKRCGVGTQMMSKLVSKLCANKRDVLKVDVLDENLPAQLFLRKLGIRCIGSDGYWYQFRYRI